MKKIFWFGLGVGVGLFAAKKALKWQAEIMERGLAGNIALAVDLANRAAASTSRRSGTESGGPGA